MADLRARPLATEYTFAFVRCALPAPARDVLEVGCGSGELAHKLAAEGLRVRAIDSDPEAVEAARSAGTAAEVLTWPSAVGQLFDAVLFTRSLHHIGDLDQAVDHARAALRPGGRIIVEDFRPEAEDFQGARSFIERARELQRGGRCAGCDLDELEHWLCGGVHEHELHSSRAMELSLARHGQCECEDAAYYFRYLEPHVSQVTARELLREEVALIATGAIAALGRRFMLAPDAR